MEQKNKYDSLGYYQILNVSFDSSEDDIRQKYRELAKFWHPDHNTDPKAVDMFQKISVAYDILKDAKSRLKYTLLSIIYNTQNFPDINALCTLKNMKGQDDVNLRSIHLIEVTGKILGHSKIDKIYYCSPSEATRVVKQITKHNWFYGFWGISALFVNIWAIFRNFFAFNNKKENLFLCIHNALAFADDKKYSEALTMALLAKEFANKDELYFINLYIQNLNNYSPLSIKRWNIAKLRRIQLFYPCFLILLALIICGGLYLKNVEDLKKNSVSVKEIVVFSDGRKAFSDVAVARIFDIPVDIHDKKYLYHLTQTTQAMHGADESFDVYATIEAGETVRLTGYTADKRWSRVMFDNGEMAFVKSEVLQQGIGKEIPLWSKIYKE